ncbi:hypothetical protein DL769_004877 [Monosporascus sp. CRB-8-3]|nr:hypothetical protein DL769_004877 [Monosporascus sp. CRB-8-3]
MVVEDLCKSAGVTHTPATQLEAPILQCHLIRHCGELEGSGTVMRNAAVNGIVTRLLRLADDSNDPPDKLLSFFDEKIKGIAKDTLNASGGGTDNTLLAVAKRCYEEATNLNGVLAAH